MRDAKGASRKASFIVFACRSSPDARSKDNAKQLPKHGPFDQRQKYV
tara:strand:+ start:351 stop:491 length:141 start_codon:yes stop_codon:yes gene_type:complete